MTFLNLLRRLFGLLSLAILATAVYLIWTGYQRSDEGDPGLDPALAGEGDETRLWIGWGLLAFSLLGRFILTPLLAKGEKDTVPITRGEGRTVAGPDGSELRVESFGAAEAPTIVLTHGWGLDSTVWRYARRDLGDRFRLIVWDLPGLGRSKAPSGHIQLDNFAEDLRAVIQAEAGGRPVVIVGHSIGGMTAQTLAGLRPELMGEQVKGIVLVNTTHLRPILTTAASGLVQALWPVFSVLLRLQILLSPLVHLQKWQSYMSGSVHLAARIGGFGRHVTRAQLEHTARLMTKASPAVEAKGDFAMMDWDVTRKLPDIKVPVLVLAGELDLITKPSASRTISEAIPGAQLKIMPGCGHMGFYEYSAAYNTEIAAFAEQVLGGAGAAPQPPAGATVRTA